MPPSGLRWALFPAAVTALGFGLVLAGVAASSGTRPVGAEVGGAGKPALGTPPFEPPPLAPFTPSTIPEPARVVPRGLVLEPGAAPELVGVQWADAWEDRRALFRRNDDVRAYAVTDSLPGGEVLLSISPDGVTVSRDDSVVRLSSAGEVEVVEDFPMADRRDGFESRAAPVDPELEAAVYETLALLQLGEPETAQLALDALVAAGEAVVPFLVQRADSLQSLPSVQVDLPDGRSFSPRWEGVAAQAALEAITGQRFGDVLATDVTLEQILDAAESWRSWLGLPN